MNPSVFRLLPSKIIEIYHKRWLSLSASFDDDEGFQTGAGRNSGNQRQMSGVSMMSNNRVWPVRFGRERSGVVGE